VRSVDLEASPEAVRARFKWALQQGNHVWLWPEISPHKWQAALGEIARATGHVLAGNSGQVVVRGDPADFGIAAFTSGMGPLLGYWAEMGLLHAEPALLSLLKDHFAHNSERMKRLEDHARTAVDELSRAGIKVTVLKGMHTAYSYFPACGTRPLSDIDLLVDRTAEPVANRVLRSLRYWSDPPTFGAQTWRLEGIPTEPPSLSLVHKDGPWSIDLHTSLNRKCSPGAPMIQLDRALRLRSISRWPLSPHGEVLTGAYLLHHLACHASSGLVSLSLLRLTELIFVIRKLEERDGLSWTTFLELAALTGSPGSSYPALQMANMLAPGVVPEGVSEALRHMAPPTVKRVLASLTPATCQRILRCSLTERFMWTRSLRGWVREVRGSLFPTASFGRLVWIYKLRVARLLNGSVTL